MRSRAGRRGIQQKPDCTGMAAAHFLSGYLVARFDLGKHRRAVSYATGVRKIVEFGSGPVELDATMIDAIKERVSDDYVTLMPVRPVHGQIVHIKGGPLAGLEAVFMREM